MAGSIKPTRGTRRRGAALLALAAALLSAPVAWALGELSQKPGTAGCVSENGTGGLCQNGKALENATGVATSPDGRNVYVASVSSDAVAVFDREPATGALTQKPGTAGCLSEDGTGGLCQNGTALDGAAHVVVSVDGKSVYVTSDPSDAVAILDRDTGTGALSQKPGTAGCVSADGSGGACQNGTALEPSTRRDRKPRRQKRLRRIGGIRRGRDLRPQPGDRGAFPEARHRRLHLRRWQRRRLPAGHRAPRRRRRHGEPPRRERLRRLGLPRRGSDLRPQPGDRGADPEAGHRRVHLGRRQRRRLPERPGPCRPVVRDRESGRHQRLRHLHVLRRGGCLRPRPDDRGAGPQTRHRQLRLRRRHRRPVPRRHGTRRRLRHRRESGRQQRLRRLIPVRCAGGLRPRPGDRRTDPEARPGLRLGDRDRRLPGRHRARRRLRRRGEPGRPQRVRQLPALQRRGDLRPRDAVLASAASPAARHARPDRDRRRLRPAPLPGGVLSDPDGRPRGDSPPRGAARLASSPDALRAGRRAHRDRARSPRPAGRRSLQRHRASCANGGSALATSPLGRSPAAASPPATTPSDSAAASANGRWRPATTGPPSQPPTPSATAPDRPARPSRSCAAKGPSTWKGPQCSPASAAAPATPT